MKVLYILGNGFDLNLGLKTSYKDFYDYYKSIESPSEKINGLKKSISNNYKNWSDLELALGQYTEELNTLEDFDEVFEDIGAQLAEYLKKEENKFDLDSINRERFFKNLINPEEFLPIADSNKIKTYKSNFNSKNWFVDIITFNYTTIIDKIIGESKNLNITHHATNSRSTILKGVEHIHGYVDNRMVLGVNDISQLKNKSFHDNEDVLEAIVKEKCNKAYRHTIDDIFKTKIRQADFICIFGASMGDTDNMWWELIGKKLETKPMPLIIFTKGEEVISDRIGYKNNRTERKMRNYFLKKTKLSEEVKTGINGNIFVVLDSNIFKDLN